MQCPFNAAQYKSIFLHSLTTGAFAALVATGSLFDDDTAAVALVPVVAVVAALTAVIVAAWVFTSSSLSLACPTDILYKLPICK